MGHPNAMGSILKDNEPAILREWVDLQMADNSRREILSATEVGEQSRAFLASLSLACQTSYDEGMLGTHWDDLRASLSDLSKNRAHAGFSPSETATFVFSLKAPLFAALRHAYAADAKRLNHETLLASAVLDKLGLLTVEAHQRGREQVIARQQQELLDLSTPVIKLWDGVLAIPLIGTLDSERTQTVMESLLEAIVSSEATVAIIDITGVPTVDTLVAQHLLKTVAAARLMGAECIISGIRPQIAQTIVHLGVDLGDVATRSTLADALRIALAKRGLRISAATGA
ncbi:STAS domain-containing protein [Ramlibacter pallidus]|uniref:STAS domain-containing protein n=1 Tax=Ramlibacter pallidus TaxID=2780087 RepID=A0ABR9S3M2_9BURK|nr:STAS domain-containing protein [Ramlibacter pallidus]MBE7368105.1 STAS domain-containing protein [Ramlibacter pallidus]